MKERDIEAYLTRNVKQMGGQVRKVQWIGHSKAPDRVVMLPPFGRFGRYSTLSAIWIELKAPGLKATFPSNAHERAQAREHKKMRKCGQTVLVIDSKEEIDEVLR